MNQWENPVVDLGIIEQHSKHKIVFKYSGDKKLIKASASCGCSKPKIKKNEVHVTYTSGAIPKHIVMQGKDSYNTTKQISVEVESIKRPVILNFKATIKANIKTTAE